MGSPPPANEWREHKACDSRLHHEMEESRRDSRHSEPFLRSPCEQRLHRPDRGCEGGMLADRVHTRIKAKEFKDHLIEVKAAATAALPARTGECMLDHGAPKCGELLGRLDRPQTVSEPIPEEALDPLMGGRTQFQDWLPQRSRILGRRQTRNGAGYDAEDPAVEFTWEAVDLLIVRIVDTRDGLKDKTEKQANETQPFAPFVPRTGGLKIQPRERRRYNVSIEPQLLRIEFLNRPFAMTQPIGPAV